MWCNFAVRDGRQSVAPSTIGPPETPALMVEDAKASMYSASIRHTISLQGEQRNSRTVELIRSDTFVAEDVLAGTPKEGAAAGAATAGIAGKVSANDDEDVRAFGASASGSGCCGLKEPLLGRLDFASPLSDEMTCRKSVRTTGNAAEGKKKNLGYEEGGEGRQDDCPFGQ
jgi:hypothetical protein